MPTAKETFPAPNPPSSPPRIGWNYRSTSLGRFVVLTVDWDRVLIRPEGRRPEVLTLSQWHALDARLC